MKLDELVRRRRAERNLSLRQVADAGKLSPGGVYKVEMGGSVDPSLSTMLGLAKALKLKPAMVFEAARESYERGSDDRDGRGDPDLADG